MVEEVNIAARRSSQYVMQKLFKASLDLLEQVVESSLITYLLHLER
jgi:hypothetical protein